MADKQSLVQRWNPRLRNPMLKVESVIAFREYWFCCPWASVWDQVGYSSGRRRCWSQPSGGKASPEGGVRTWMSQHSLMGCTARRGLHRPAPLCWNVSSLSPGKRDRDEFSLCRGKVCSLSCQRPGKSSLPCQFVGRDSTNGARSVTVRGTTSALCTGISHSPKGDVSSLFSCSCGPQHSSLCPRQ